MPAQTRLSQQHGAQPQNAHHPPETPKRPVKRVRIDEFSSSPSPEQQLLHEAGSVKNHSQSSPSSGLSHCSSIPPQLDSVQSYLALLAAKQAHCTASVQHQRALLTASEEHVANQRERHKSAIRGADASQSNVDSATKRVQDFQATVNRLRSSVPSLCSDTVEKSLLSDTLNDNTNTGVTSHAQGVLDGLTWARDAFSDLQRDLQIAEEALKCAQCESETMRQDRDTSLTQLEAAQDSLDARRGQVEHAVAVEKAGLNFLAMFRENWPWE